MKRNDRLGMRVRALDKKKWKEKAVSEGKSLSAWIEKTLNEASRG